MKADSIFAACFPPLDCGGKRSATPLWIPQQCSAPLKTVSETPSNRMPPDPNPKGIASSSPGLRGTSYPGLPVSHNHNPERVATAFGIAGRTHGFRQITLIAAKEFGDRFRSGWVIACVLVWLGAIGLTSFLGLLQIGRIGLQGYERTVISMLNVVQYLVPLLALLLGHDLIVGENEERTLRLILAGGTSRAKLLVGKFLGGCITLAVTLLLGFIIAGTVIGLAAKDAAIIPFLRLAISGLLLGIIFLGVGLALSTFCRTRVQALVAALLTWCVAVFVFDLVALGVLVSANAPAAAQQIEIVCDATHVNAAVDLHSDFETSANPTAKHSNTAVNQTSSVGWLLINPVDLFRAFNLSRQIGLGVPTPTMLAIVTLWLGTMLSLSFWKLRRTDL